MYDIWYYYAINFQSICCVPMPTTLKRLVIIVESILKVIECPVCNATITPPVMQCQNGHLLCLDCRIRSEKCPMCRGFFTPIRSGVAEDIYSIIAGAFKSFRREGNLRHKVFGEMALTNAKSNFNEPCVCREPLKQHKSLLPTNRILTKLLQAKTDSLENLFQCNSAKLLHAEAIDSFNVLPLKGSTEKGLEPRLTSTSMQKCTNDVQQLPESADERDAILKAVPNCGSNHNCNATDSFGQEYIVRRGGDCPPIGGQNTVVAATAPSVVNELWTEPPVKAQSKCFVCPTLPSPTSGVRRG